MVSRAAPPRGTRESARKVWARNAVLEASPNAVVAVDSGGLIVYANPQVETTFGYERAELVGQPIEILLPERAAANRETVRDAFVTHPVARPMGIGLDLAGRRKDGTEFPVEMSLSPVKTADGLQIVATIVDLAARKGAENQLLQTEKLESIGRLAGGIAHDFNNMLFAIHGYAELLAQDLGSDDPERLEPERLLHSVNAISQAAERAATLTAQLLAFSRQQMVKPKVLDVNAAVTAIEPMLRQLIGENMNLVIKLDPATGHIRADAGQIDQIVVNLVVNARDAMASGGTVTIESGNAAFEAEYASDHFDVKPGPYVFVAVSDNGMGMDRATRDHIFEPFFTTKEVGKGTGLGLSTTYGIVHQSGGHIWLYSEPGHGSAFKLYFPSVDAEIEEPPPVSDPPMVGVGTILVVEDEPSVRDMTTQLFERAGYDVLAVADATEAMTTARSVEAVDVLVTDVVMPGMSGIELAEQMMDRYPRLGVVLLSGYTAETLDLERITARGATFVPKPVTSNQLLETALRAVAARRAATGSR
jgi:two-component system cell cycle sensor histidine kinase/response regulator CckA